MHTRTYNTNTHTFNKVQDMINLSGWSGNSLLRKISLSSSPCYKQYKLLSVRLCTTGKIFRSLKGYTDMLYNTFHFSFVALLLLLFPSSSIFFSISATTVFSPERSHLTFLLHFRAVFRWSANNTLASDNDPEPPSSGFYTPEKSAYPSITQLWLSIG